MTQYTNIHGVDPVIAAAVSRSTFYGRPDADFTVTGLGEPAQKSYLTMVHQHEIVQDVGENLWSLLGQAVHEVLRRAADQVPETIAEERLRATIQLRTTGREVVVAGKPDLWRLDPDHGGLLTDYKVTSVWKYLLGDKSDWEGQLNQYRWLYHQAGFDTRTLRVSSILRDWKVRDARAAEAKRKAGEPEDYPPIPFMGVDLPVWKLDACADHLLTRAEVHDAARNGQYRPCDNSERWYGGDRWAVIPRTKDNKRWQKKAWAVFGKGTGRGGGEEEANAFAAERRASGFTVRIEKRVDVSTRCLDYCSVVEWCDQGSKEVASAKRQATE